MPRSRILLFILLNVLHRFNCLQRSDWTFDRETEMVNFTSNGKTYSCRSWDITEPISNRAINSIDKPCLNDVDENDTECIKTDFLKIFSNAMSSVLRSNTSCDAPVPSAEDTYQKVEKVYASWSLDDNPATQKWYDRALENLSRIETECRENETALFRPEYASTARNHADSAFTLGRLALPKLMNEVSDAQTVLNAAKREEMECKLDLRNRDDELHTREQLLTLEVTALMDKYEFELADWRLLAQTRSNFIKLMSIHTEMGRIAAVATQGVVRARMDMLLKMAKANELLATIDAQVREVSYNMGLMCERPDNDEEDENVVGN